jgi:hypothetical protein
MLCTPHNSQGYDDTSLFSLRLDPGAFTTTSSASNSSNAARLATPTSTVRTTAAAGGVSTSISSSSSSSSVPLFSAVTEWRHLTHDNVTTATSTLPPYPATTAATTAATATSARKRSLELLYSEQAVHDEGYEVLPQERQRANSLGAIQVSLLTVPLHYSHVRV